MKKIFSILGILALLVLTPMVSAMSQTEVDLRVNNRLRTSEDYKDLIASGNKIKIMSETIGLEYDEEDVDLVTSSKVFRAIRHSDGFKEFRRARSGWVIRVVNSFKYLAKDSIGGCRTLMNAKFISC